MMINTNRSLNGRSKVLSEQEKECAKLLDNLKDLDEKSKTKANAQVKDYLCQPKFLSAMAKAIALYLRNGVLEDIHADGNLSQSNMKDINIEAANKIAGLLTLVASDDWIRLMLFFMYHGVQISDWDMPTPYMDELDALYDFCTGKRPQGNYD